MLDIFEPLSLTSGAVVVALLSALAVWLLTFALPPSIRWLAVVVVPFGFAYALYWFPVWLGVDASEYGPWQVVCVGTWFLAGVVPSAAVVWIRRKRGIRS